MNYIRITDATARPVGIRVVREQLAATDEALGLRTETGRGIMRAALWEAFLEGIAFAQAELLAQLIEAGHDVRIDED